jgi:RNA polymerase sigma-70 factor (ECF subfamily)
MTYGARSRVGTTALTADRQSGDEAATELRVSVALALAAARGDARATTALLTLVAPAVLRAVRMILGARMADRDDVNQQAMLNVMRALSGFRGDCHPAGYAARIAVHTALSARRSARSERLSYCDPRELAEVSPPSSSGDDELAAFRKHLLREVLQRLPPEQAEVMALHVILGHSLPEVAAITETPLNTVKSRLRLAKEALRRHLTDELPQELAHDLAHDGRARP